MRRPFYRILPLLLLLASFASAQNVTGVVNNGTTNKPAAGVEVVLVDPMQGMAEVTKTKTDAQGKYSLPLGQASGPRLLRASKDGANYFKMLTPGTTTADLEIYDAAKKVDGVTGTVNVIRLQTEGNTLQVLELYALKNASSPPRTVVGDNTFEVVLPEGAQLDGGDAQGPNGQPLSLSPEPTKQKNHYAFSFALRPGETRFQLGYHLPYNGEATFVPHLLRAYNHVVVVVPQSMQFEPKEAAAFRSMPDQSGTNIQVVSNAKAGQDLSFRVSGTGKIPDEQEAQGGQGAQQQGGGEATSNDNRPGGGLGPPIDAPDPLTKYKWWILGLFAVVLGGGAYIMMSRPVPGAPAPAASTTANGGPRPSSAKAAAASNGDGNTLLDAMKEELFQLEIERQQGAISQEEYEKHKSALDQTLQRALSRAGKG